MKKRLPTAPAAAPAPEPGLLTLESNLGHGGAEALRKSLLEALTAQGAARTVRLNAEAVEQLGTASLQVLLAAAAMLKKQGRGFILERPSPGLCEWARLAGVNWLVEGQKAGSGVQELRSNS
jgi:anti-anti-sigma regulatory factor